MQIDNSFTRDERKDKKNALFLIFLTTIVYTVSYIGRKSYDANINEAMSFFGVEKDIAGIVGTAFFIAYGIGQVVHGLLCSKYNFKYTIFAAMIIGAVCNFTVAVLPPSAFGAVKFIWLINGFSQASLWSSIVLIFNSVLAKRYSRLALYIMCFPVAVGTFLGYGLSALFSVIGNFKLVFYTAAVLLFAMGAVWFFAYGSLKDRCKEAKVYYDGEESEISNNGNNLEKGKASSFWIVFAVMCLLAVANNFVKDGLTTWAPTFLKEKYGLENWLSVLLTLFLPVCALFGSAIALAINKNVKNYFVLSGILFAASAVAMGIMVACINLNTFAISLACFAFTACLMAGVNNVTTAIFPMESKGNVNAGLVAGLIDGFCYVGSALSSYGFGAIAENGGGWNAVMNVILYSLIVATVVCSVCFVVGNLLKKRKILK